MFRGWLGMAAAGFVLATSPLARAAPPAPAPPRLGVDLGIQVGYGLAFGSVGENQMVDEIVSGTVPIAIEASYRIDETIAAGVLMQYGFVRFKDTETACPTGATCGGFVASTMAHFTFWAPVPWTTVPWFRLGAGYEWMRLSLDGNINGAPSDLVVTYRGLMFGTAQLGAEYRLTHDVGLGPFAGLSIGRYDHMSASGTFSGTPLNESMPIPDKAAHEWLVFGVRGVFRL